MATPSFHSSCFLRFFNRKIIQGPHLPRRSLHITGVKSAQPAKGVDTAALYSSKSTAGLRTECERRGLLATGSHIELAHRLANNDQLQSRAFSIAMKRIEHGSPFKTTSSRQTRNSASIVNFGFMSNLESESTPKTNMRVPVFPDTSSGHLGAESGEESMSQKIYTVAGRTNEVASPSVTVDHPSDPFDAEKVQDTISSVRYTESNVFDGRVSSIAKDFWRDMTGMPTVSSSPN